MITPTFVQTMADYNVWQNQSLMQAADDLPYQALSEDRGAFFGSILGTFSHLLWGDRIWMSRFDNWTAPDRGIPESAAWYTDWTAFKKHRKEADQKIKNWAGRIRGSDLADDLEWFSGALNKAVKRPTAVCVAHFFNHQTHHRGQLHAMLTQAGARPDDTDLFMMPGHW